MHELCAQCMGKHAVGILSVADEQRVLPGERVRHIACRVQVPEKHVPKARVGFDSPQIAGGEDTIEVIGVEAEYTQFVHSGLIIRQQCDFYATCMAVVEQRLYPRFGIVVARYDTYHSG